MCFNSSPRYLSPHASRLRTHWFDSIQLFPYFLPPIRQSLPTLAYAKAYSFKQDLTRTSPRPMRASLHEVDERDGLVDTSTLLRYEYAGLP